MLWQKLQQANLAVNNFSLATDMIACPGMDFCSLATARSIPLAQDISNRLKDVKHQLEIGKIHINISGCINACGHHHVGNIGILGLDKKNQEYYQITLGGSSENNATIGDIVGHGFSYEEVPEKIEQILNIYLEIRQGNEIFLETYRRVGIEPFKAKLYASA